MKKKQLFSLRKLSVGIASVSLGTLVFFRRRTNSKRWNTRFKSKNSRSLQHD
mgnify:CR=1 FL=1